MLELNGFKNKTEKKPKINNATFIFFFKETIKMNQLFYFFCF